jgi:hypothetical protein
VKTFFIERRRAVSLGKSEPQNNEKSMLINPKLYYTGGSAVYKIMYNCVFMYHIYK